MDRPSEKLKNSPLLRVENLWVRKGGLRNRKWIVKDASFEVGQREFVAIIGPNGAGKTKLLEAIVGDRPYAGKITISDHDLYQQPEYWLQRIGWVPSYNVLHDSLRAEQALQQVARLRLPRVSEAVVQKRVRKLLDQLEFPPARRGAFIRDLSSGERKRLDLCAELITNPPLLILDEPTTNLDPDAERYLMELLRNRSWGKHQAVIVVTHTLQSLYLCDRLIFMARGCLRAEGSPQQVLGKLECELLEMGSHSGDGLPGSESSGCNSVQLETTLEPAQRDIASRWAAVYRMARQLDEPTITAPPGREKENTTTKPLSSSVNRSVNKSWVHELRILLKRNWLLIINNPFALVLFLALGPFSGLLSRIVLRENAFIKDDGISSYSAVFDTTDARQAVFIIALVVTLIGLIGSFMDVTRERLIYRYERIKGLSPWAYLLSKWIVLSLLVGIIAPSFLILVLTFNGQELPMPQYALATLYLACIAAVTLGLAISAIAHTERTATGLLGVVVVFYLFFSGGVEFNENFRGLLERLSVFAASHWAAEGLSSGIKLYCWASNPRFQDFFSLGHLISIWLYLAVYILVALLIAFIALRFQDAWFLSREKVWKAITNRHVWSVIPLVTVAFSWGFFFRARSSDFYNLRVDEDNIRVANSESKDLFQTINGYMGESKCPVPAPLPAPVIHMVALPPAPTLHPSTTPFATQTSIFTSALMETQYPVEIDPGILPLPVGKTVRPADILFSPGHGELPLETLPIDSEFTLLGKDMSAEWYRIREQATGRNLVGWVPAGDTNLPASQTGAVGKPPACAAPRAYLEADGASPFLEWESDVDGHAVLVVDLFRDHAGMEARQGELSVVLDAQVVDQYPINPTRHSFLFRGLAIDVRLFQGQKLQLTLLDAPFLGNPLHMRASIFYVTEGCSF